MTKAKRETGIIAPVNNTLSLEARGLKALSELCEKNYVFKLPTNIFAVNKNKIHDMQIIGIGR